MRLHNNLFACLSVILPRRILNVKFSFGLISGDILGMCQCGTKPLFSLYRLPLRVDVACSVCVCVKALFHLKSERYAPA